MNARRARPRSDGPIPHHGGAWQRRSARGERDGYLRHDDELFAIFRAAGIQPHEVIDTAMQQRYAEWLAGASASH